MRFWDSSAIVPLLVGQAASASVVRIARSDPGMTVWWSTVVECASALARIDRTGTMHHATRRAALARLEVLSARWHEVTPAQRVRDVARRLLVEHPLRAADALQLAAAVVGSGEVSARLPFVCLDERLRAAAAGEGFPVLPE